MSAADDLWNRALAVFQAAVELPAADRSAHLAVACAGDAALRERVEALLAADRAPGAQFAGNAGEKFALLIQREQRMGGDTEAEDVALAAWRGRQLGPYRIAGELGQGGMGAVFLGERCDGQFEQRVALKVARLGLTSDEATRRFLAERQILAGLEHPQIARLLDGGVTAEGLPYFAMEYVAGTPITLYCDAEGLATARRIELFLGVCAAVDHAHRRLVVHRDLKPSNILVTAAGEVKLLDFGIAKLLLEDGAAFTRTTDRVLTPGYAAPEQLLGQTITTATDVYALGVVLYELLVGRRPHLAGEPVKPSSAVLQRESGDSAAPPPRRLRRALRGDLDTIVLTALRREPDRRYPSAAALADDLRRHLAGLPIRARPDTLRYRAAKFAGRHRWALSGATALLLALLLALAAAVEQARAREREARGAQAVTAFLVGLFEGPDPARARGAALTAQELLDQGVERLRGQLLDQPEARSRILHAVAGTYVALGLYERALPLARDALDLRRRRLPAARAEIADSLEQVGQILRLEAAYDRAAPLLREALALRRAGARRPDLAVATSLAALGSLLHDRGDFQGADRALREGLAIAERTAGPRDLATARLLAALAGNLQDMGHTAESAALYRRVLAIREERLGRFHPDVASTLHDLGVGLQSLNDLAGAEASLRRALAIRQAILGGRHPAVGHTELALADLCDQMERYDEAERHARAALAIYRESLGEEHPKVTEAMNMLAVLLVRRRRFDDAIPLQRSVLARNTRAVGETHPDTLAIKNTLAYMLMHVGQWAEAESLQRAVLADTRLDNGQDPLILNRENLARTLEETGRAAEAVARLREALEWQRRRFGDRHPGLPLAMRLLALAQELDGDEQAAESGLHLALEQARALGPEDASVATRNQIALADFLVARRRPAEAEPLLRDAQAALVREHEPDPIWQAETALLLGRCLGARGREREGAATIAAARARVAAMQGGATDLFPAARALFDGHFTPGGG